MDNQETIPFQKMVRAGMVQLCAVPAAGYLWQDDLVLSPLSDNDFLKATHPAAHPVFCQNPWLIPDRSIDARRQYAPFAVQNLHRKFAALTEKASLDAIKDFADRWGSLGHEVNLYKKDKHPLTYGLSLRYWRFEIGTFANLIELWDIVKDELDNKLRGCVTWEKNPRQVRFKYKSTRFEYSRADVLDNLEYGDSIGPVRFYVHDAINKRMRGHISPYILPFVDSNIYFSPDCLLSSLYAQLAFEVSGYPTEGHPPIICKGCKKTVPVSDGYTKYCSPSCRERTKKRKQRAKKREAKQRELRQ